MTNHALPGGLLADEALHESSVMANCAMNRQRHLTGVNYTGQPVVNFHYREHP